MKTFAFAALAFLANAQQAPSTTAAPVSTTAAGVPVNPAALPPIIPTDPRFLSCESSTCSGRIIEVTPAENFILDCVAPNGCAGAQIYINVGYDPNRPQRAVDNIEEILFQEAGSGEGASIHISNTLLANGHIVELNDVVCEKAGSCTGLTIYAGEGVDFNGRQVDCAMPGACVGCTVHVAGTIEPCGEIPIFNQAGPPAQVPPAQAPPAQAPPAAQPQQPANPVVLPPPVQGFPVWPGAPVQYV